MSQPSVVTGGYVETFIPPVVSIPTVTLPFTETWTVADALNTLSGDFPWAQVSGGLLGWSINGGTARLATASGVSQVGYLNQDTGTDDVAVTATVSLYATGTNTLSAGPLVRMPGTGVFTGYCAALRYTAGTLNFVLLRFLAGAQIQLGSVTVTPHTGMTWGVSAQGNRIRASFDNLVLIDVIDGAIPSGRYVGLQGFNDGTGAVAIDTLAVASSTARARVPGAFLSLTPLAGVG